MKKLLTIMLAMLNTAFAIAQVPQYLTFQAVIRNSDNTLAVNQSIGIQITIIEGSENSSEVYKEWHSANTNANGLVTIKVGAGYVGEGNFASIDWSKDEYFIKSETDLNGGTNYTITGMTQLLSVPYALLALNTVNAGNPISPLPAGSIIMYSGPWNFNLLGEGTGPLEGWQLCNGINNSPDLRDTFVMSANDESDYKVTGGDSVVTMEVNNLPSHNHPLNIIDGGSHAHPVSITSDGIHSHSSININNGGVHSHNLSINNSGQHKHTYIVNPFNTEYHVKWGDDSESSNNYIDAAGGPGDFGTDNYLYADVDGSNHTHTGTTVEHTGHIHTGSTNASLDHSHSGSNAISTAHSHSGQTENVGNGSAVNIMPPYIKLAYIMKL